MKSVAVLLCLALVALVPCMVSAASVCPPCDISRCEPLVVYSCKVGAGPDRCHCCLVCYQSEGQPCGETFGRCGHGLTCHRSSNTVTAKCRLPFVTPAPAVPDAATEESQAPPTAAEYRSPTAATEKVAGNEASRPDDATVPTVKPSASATTLAAAAPLNTDPPPSGSVSVQSFEDVVEDDDDDEEEIYDDDDEEEEEEMAEWELNRRLSPDKCPSPCSLDYCSDNRNKRCSVNTSEILGDDYEFGIDANCHVTSCKACFFVEDFNPTCICSHPRCLLNYGKCIKAYVRQVKVKPLGRVSETHKGKVLCKVPVSAN